MSNILEMQSLTINGERFDIVDKNTIVLNLENGEVDFIKLIDMEEFDEMNTGIKYSVNRLYELKSNTPIKFMGVKDGHYSEESTVLYETTAKKLFVRVTAYHDGNTYIKCTVLSTTEKHMSMRFTPNGLVQIEYWFDYGLMHRFSKVYEYATKENVEEIVQEALSPKDFEGVFKDFTLGSFVQPEISPSDIGTTFHDGIFTKTNTGNYRFLSVEVNKGDTWVRLMAGSDATYALYVLDESNKLVDVVYYYSGINNYSIPCNGTVVAFNNVSNDLDAVLFRIERTGEKNNVASNVRAEYSLYPVTLADVELNKRCPLSVTAYPGATLDVIDGDCSYDSNYCVFKRKVKKGDMVIFTNAHNMSANNSENKIVVFDKNGVFADVLGYWAMESPQNQAAVWSSFMSYYYEVPCDGTLYMSFPYNTVQAGEFFYIKTPHPNEPLVLYENLDYVSENEGMGDKVMKAKMEGREILVRVENSDGKNHTALYAPIYQYQMANSMNDRLYLIYLKDVKQDFSSVLGLPEGTVALPQYGQIELKLSHTYNHTPLV